MKPMWCGLKQSVLVTQYHANPGVYFYKFEIPDPNKPDKLKHVVWLDKTTFDYLFDEIGPDYDNIAQRESDAEWESEQVI